MGGIWDEEAGGAFVQVVLSEARKLGRVEAGFKKQTWTSILHRLNQVVQQAFTKAQLQGRLQQVKKKYAVYIELISNSGFGICPRTGGPTAPDSVWDEYLQKHAKAKQFCEKPLQYYDELHEIFGGVIASGRHAQSSTVSVAEDNSNIDSSPLWSPIPASRQISTASSPPGSSGPPGPPGRSGAPSTSDPPGRPGAPSTPGTSGTPSTPCTPGRPGTSSRSGRPGGPGTPDCPTPAPASSSTPDSPSQTTTLGRRRRTSGVEKLVERQGRRVRQRARSQVEIAITSFIADHSTGMSAAERVRYVNYFVANPMAADAFNVLDDDTKAAYLTSLAL